MKASRVCGEEISRITLLTRRSRSALTAHPSEYKLASNADGAKGKALLLWKSGKPEESLAIQAAPKNCDELVQEDATLHLTEPTGGICHIKLTTVLEEEVEGESELRSWEDNHIADSSEALLKIDEPLSSYKINNHYHNTSSLIIYFVLHSVSLKT